MASGFHSDCGVGVHWQDVRLSPHRERHFDSVSALVPMKPLVTDEEIDRQMADPLSRAWLAMGWRNMKRGMAMSEWLTKRGGVRGPITITWSRFSESPDPEPTDAELRAYARATLERIRQEWGDIEDRKRRAEETICLLGRTT